MSEEITVTKVEKPNSFEVGSAGARHKIYYGEVDELKDRLLKLKALGLVDLEGIGFILDKLEEKDGKQLG